MRVDRRFYGLISSLILYDCGNHIQAIYSVYFQICVKLWSICMTILIVITGHRPFCLRGVFFSSKLSIQWCEWVRMNSFNFLAHPKRQQISWLKLPLQNSLRNASSKCLFEMPLWNILHIKLQRTDNSNNELFEKLIFSVVMKPSFVQRYQF